MLFSGVSGMNKELNSHMAMKLLVALLLCCFVTVGFAQTLAAGSNPMSGAVTQAEKDKIINKNIVAIDKGCVNASLIVKNQLIEKQNNKFNLLAAIDDIKVSQLAFIQKSTLTAYLVYVDAIEPSDVNPPLMASQYMLNCLSFVRH